MLKKIIRKKWHQFVRTPFLINAYLRQEGIKKLHIGAGQNILAGWLNSDIYTKNNKTAYLDASKPFPFPCDTFHYIFSEHFIEHLFFEQGNSMLAECWRVLKRQGKIRIATPDLDYLIQKYISPSWKAQEWIEKFNYQTIQTRAEMLNICFREWGHKYLYNAEELERRLREAGFEKIERQQWNASKHAELANRETRKDSKLILEAVK